LIRIESAILALDLDFAAATSVRVEVEITLAWDPGNNHSIALGPSIDHLELEHVPPEQAYPRESSRRLVKKLAHERDLFRAHRGLAHSPEILTLTACRSRTEAR
jgi:hypothetical protein